MEVVRGSRNASTPGKVRHRSRTGRKNENVRVARVHATDVDGSEEGKVVFVAGATGKVGFRAVRELARRGYQVRAGVRNLEKGNRCLAYQDLPEKLAYTGQDEEMRKQWNQVSLENVRAVAFDVDRPETLADAIGDAKVVVSCLGAPESEIFDVDAPRRIDGQGTSALVRAAADLGVEHFVMVSSLGAGRFGMPASLLNAWGKVLEWKKESEDVLRRSGMKYTIVRPGGMERPTDDFGKDANLVLARADTRFGGLVSNLQVAELIGEVVQHPTCSTHKTLEVVAEKGAPKADAMELLGRIPVEHVGDGLEGTTEHYQSKYKYDPKKEGWTGKLLDASEQLETFHGRLSMLGIVAALGAQSLGRGAILEDQLDGAGVRTFVLLLALVLGVAGAQPWLKDVSREDAQLPPFVPLAETWNGRLAMLGFASALYLEHYWSLPVLSTWWLLF